MPTIGIAGTPPHWSDPCARAMCALGASVLFSKPLDSQDLLDTLAKRASAPQKVKKSIRQQTADIPAGNYLFLRCSGDEAAAALSAAQIIAWGAIKISKMLELLTRPLFNPGRPLARVVSWGVFTSLVFPSLVYGFSVLPDISKSGLRYLLWPDGLFRTNDLVVILVYMAVSLLK